MNYRVINFNIHGDAKGKLIALENNREIPFEVKHVYYMFDTLLNESRGFHAHKNLRQVIIAMDGACRFVLYDGNSRDGAEPSRCGPLYR